MYNNRGFAVDLKNRKPKIFKTFIYALPLMARCMDLAGFHLITGTGTGFKPEILDLDVMEGVLMVI